MTYPESHSPFAAAAGFKRRPPVIQARTFCELSWRKEQGLLFLPERDRGVSWEDSAMGRGGPGGAQAVISGKSGARGLSREQHELVGTKRDRKKRHRGNRCQGKALQSGTRMPSRQRGGSKTEGKGKITSLGCAALLSFCLSKVNGVLAPFSLGKLRFLLTLFSEFRSP